MATTDTESKVEAARAMPGFERAITGIETGASIDSSDQPASSDRRELLRLMSETQRCMMSRLGPAGASDWLRLELTTAQLKTLFCLVAGGEQPMSHLAHSLAVGLPTATSLVDKLVEAGFVEREHSHSDRRVVLVHPTAKGVEMTMRLRAFQEDQWRRLLTFIPDDAVPALIESTRILLDASQRLAESARSVSTQ